MKQNGSLRQPSPFKKDIVSEIQRIDDAPTRKDLQPLLKMLQDLQDGLDRPDLYAPKSRSTRRKR